MPSDIAIRVDNLGKRYVIGRQRPVPKSLSGKLARAFASPFDWLSSQIKGPSGAEIFWALRDVSFEVKRGEVLGVIGRNGAGKSTLLKILSRITEPTTGKAEIHGRVGSLLEVGTGMHPELTGRENIYLNGCILGMRKTEIDRKFDEIVDFSGIEKFIDTPVKRYSSGMRVRLGFAIAAHLEPEILIVDEVLAVGDAEFQKKCLGKMHDVAGHGRTVLFVSHNMAAVVGLCTRCLCVCDGLLSDDGATDRVVNSYVGDLLSIGLFKGRNTIIDSLRVVDETTGQEGTILAGNPTRVEINLNVKSQITRPVVGIGICHGKNRVFTVLSSHSGHDLAAFEKCGKIECRFECPPLVPGPYMLKIVLNDGEKLLETLEGVAGFNIAPCDYFASGKELSEGQGTIWVRSRWNFV